MTDAPTKIYVVSKFHATLLTPLQLVGILVIAGLIITGLYYLIAALTA